MKIDSFFEMAWIFFCSISALTIVEIDLRLIFFFVVLIPHVLTLNVLSKGGVAMSSNTTTPVYTANLIGCGKVSVDGSQQQGGFQIASQHSESYPKLLTHSDRIDLPLSEQWLAFDRWPVDALRERYDSKELLVSM